MTPEHDIEYLKYMSTKQTQPAPNHANKRTPSQKDNDLQTIAGLALKGCSESGIAIELNKRNAYTLSRSQVHADLVILRRHWSQAAAADTSELLGSELEKLNFLERHYWTIFDKTNEIRALDGVGKVISQRIGLLGLSRPERLELTANGQPFQFAQLIVPPRQVLDREA